MKKHIDILSALAVEKRFGRSEPLMDEASNLDGAMNAPKLNQSALSQHLARLRAAKLVHAAQDAGGLLSVAAVLGSLNTIM